MSKRFYHAFKEALDAAGMSVAEVCRRAGVSVNQVNKMMQRGSKGEAVSTNVDDAVRLANALGLTLDELLEDATAHARSEAATLWRQFDRDERDLLLAAIRGIAVHSRAEGE
ncbi:helix-turn-helix transcriptional regulator [Rhodobacter sp. JA431]|uniref:helix-turn-helix domain-containing protein n=1 Tax=Rhodobacter sp. JA431 TaxID=570013 RepID=UPI00148250DC|nr:helix-turn-helix transcriptional regulator [Rhodobacter sp. JA431]